MKTKTLATQRKLNFRQHTSKQSFVVQEIETNAA